MKIDLARLAVVHYPHPALRQRCAPVTEFDDELRALVAKMTELMRGQKGVGLAAPQVGLPMRLFVMNATGQPGDDRVYVNPVIRDQHGNEEGEEGCLSLPTVHVQVRRAVRCRMTAQDVYGNPVEEEISELVARIMQHETDHLNGVLIIDRMGPSDRMATKRTLRALEDQYQNGVAARAG